MKVATIMTTSVVFVEMDDTVEHVLHLFHQHRFHHVLVVDRRKVLGIISDRDVLKHTSPFAGKPAERALDAETLKRRAHQIMTRDLVSVSEETLVEDAAQLMLARGISCLPVLDGEGRARGIVSWRDLMRALASRV